MFCEKCGAQLPDTAHFCNKCGNTVGTSTEKISDTGRKKKKGRGWAKLLAGILLLIGLVVFARTVFSEVEKRTSIYGTWTDANETVTFTFSQDGNLRVSGTNNILGADAFEFTEEEGVIHLQAKGFSGVGINLRYEIVDNALNIRVKGKSMTLYRAEASESESGKGILESWVENTLDTVQGYALYGTWADSDGVISFTFSEDGKLHISGLEDTLSVNIFTFSQVDGDTLQLKADTDNPILGMVGLNMDYKIEGDSMTVAILGKEWKLIKKR